MAQLQTTATQAGKATLQARPAGRLADGREVTEYLLDNGCGLSLAVLDLGGIVSRLTCPDRDGRPGNVVVGLARLQDHVDAARNFGSLVGRFAGRIAGGQFRLGEQCVLLTRNEGAHSLHGGSQGWGTQLWQVAPVSDVEAGDVAIELSLDSADGDQGYPGRVSMVVRYTLTRAGAWRLDYRASTSRTTVLNPTHHVYWNLAGGGSIEQHRLTLAASRYAELDDTLIPGALRAVLGTPLDFRAGRTIAAGLREPHAQIRVARGFDHFFEIDRQGPGLALAARLEDPGSGRVMEIETTEPGVQFYSGNFLDGRVPSASGALLRQGDGLCLETQHIGNAPNRAEAASVLLRPGEVFASTTVHRFGTVPR